MHASFVPSSILSEILPAVRPAVGRRSGWLLGAALLAALSPAAVLAVTREEIHRREWLQLTAPGLTIISDASAAQVKKWAAEIEWFRRAQQTALALPAPAREKPATIFLFSSDGALRPFLPLVDGKPLRVSALFAESIGANLGAVPLSGSRFDTRERLYHELTHWYLRRARVEIPLWFEEGVAQVMESFTLQGDGFRLGEPPREAFELVRIKGTPPLLPLLRQTELDYSRAGWKHGRTDLFYAQSAALTNMLLFGTKGGSLAQLGSYLAALRQNLPAESAFAAGFGVSVEEAQARLDTYIRSPRWDISTSKLDRKIDENAWPLAALSGSALDRSMAELLIATEHGDDALPLLAAVLAANPGDIEALQLKASALVRKGGPELTDEALGALVKAYRAGSRNAWICSWLGFAALDRSLVDLPDAATHRPVRALVLFQQALAADPGMKFAYDGIAALTQTQSELSPVERALLADAARVSPGSPAVQIALAKRETIDGQPDEARVRLERLLREQPALPMQVRSQAKRLLNGLPDAK
ncbi:MAG: hypothetical protein HY302_11580 [Opitutae bacterium]|nr:hypothetical protein [Opitutae bacterium]